jgi:hypothetical protein
MGLSKPVSEVLGEEEGVPITTIHFYSYKGHPLYMNNIYSHAHDSPECKTEIPQIPE